ncbi:PAS domain-containing protein [Niabella hibiscisoli]|uniref:PAS domain-containing protein n=1 Tax=Niabella hibiscisoli TaxID=1825928 RepID=UPI00293F2F51|nr:PAS domain S-box protein [Niabella hibiscisoli]
MLVADELGTMVLVNPFLLEQFGYAEKELLGQQIEKLIPERYHLRHVKHVSYYNQHPKKRPMGLGLDLYGIRKDKTEFPVEVSLGNYQTDQGKYVIAFLSDISKRKVAENALQQLNEELEQKVEDRTITLKNTVKQLAALIAETEVKDAELNRVNIFLKNIWDHAEAIILVTDKEGIIKMMNPAAERLLKYKEAELMNRKTPSIFLDNDHLAFSSFIEKVYAGQPIEREIYYTPKDGIRFPVSQTFTSMRNARGEIEGYLIISMDISRRKRQRMI